MVFFRLFAWRLFAANRRKDEMAHTGHHKNELNAIDEYLANVHSHTNKSTHEGYDILGRLRCLTCTRTCKSSDDLCAYVINNCILSTS